MDAKITSNIKTLRIDPAWGFLDQNLARGDFSKEQIENIKVNFSKCFLDGKPIDGWMREAYQQILPPKTKRKELINSINLDLKERVEKIFMTCWNGELTHSQQIMAELEVEFRQQARNLVALGKSEAIGDFLYCMHDKTHQSLVDNIYQQVWTGYQKGQPGYFSLMALALRCRKFYGFSLTDKEPINDVEQSLRLLHRLADLRVKEALHALAWIYAHNYIGEGKTKIELKFTVNQRFNMLQWLATHNDHRCQQVLANAIYFGKIGWNDIELSPAKRNNYFQEITVRNNGSNSYLSNYYEENGGHKFSAGLNLATCLAKLEALARDGNGEAYDTLIRAYLYNQIGTLNKRSLEMKAEARWQKLGQLKEIDIGRWARMMTYTYFHGHLNQGESKWNIPLSLQERYQWLIDNAKYDLYQLYNLFVTNDYSKLAEKEQLRSKKGQLRFLYNLALSDPKLAEIAKSALALMYTSYARKGKSVVDLSEEEKLVMVEKLAFTGYDEAQWKYQELINRNQGTYNMEQWEKIGQMAIFTENDNTAKILLAHSGGGEKEQVILNRLLKYRQVLISI